MRPLTRTRKTGEGFSNESGEKDSSRTCAVYIYIYIGLYLCIDTFHLFLPYLFGSAKKVLCTGETGGRENFFPPTSLLRARGLAAYEAEGYRA